MKSILILLVVVLGLATLAQAQVPRGVIAEDCTATWCVYCPNAYAGLEVMKDRYDTTEFTSVRYYATSGGLGNTETDGRISYYGVTGFPTVVFDGTIKIVGAGADHAAGLVYDPIVGSEIGRPSPLKITINSYDLTGPDGSIDFDVEVAETMADIGNVKIRTLVLQNDVTYGAETYVDVTRDILPDVGLTVSDYGQVQNVVQNFSILPDWTGGELWMAIFIQDDDDHDILQSGSTRPAPAYSLRYWSKGDRVTVGPSYGAYEYQDFAVFNLGTNADVIRVTLDPGTMPAGWSCLFSDGVDDYNTYVDLPLAPWESATFRMRITPTSPGYATPAILLTSDNLPGIERRIGYTYITDDVQVLLVDDDGAEAFEDYFIDAIEAYGTTYGVWNTNDAGVTTEALPNFDAVVWNIGWSFPSLTASDRDALGAYLEGGGNLFITGQDLGWDLHDQGGAAYLWYQDYLHALFVNDDTNHYYLSGVGGDPISDGMNLHIQGGDGANNQEYPEAISAADPSATILFTYDGTSYNGALRADTGIYRVIYLGFGYEAIDNPTDRRLLMERSLEWFGLVPMDAPENDLLSSVAAIRAFPNPAGANATLRFDMPVSGPARVAIYALDGSLVRTLIEGPQTAGRHSLAWDGLDAAGHPAPAGVYFYRLRTEGANPSGKLILAR